MEADANADADVLRPLGVAHRALRLERRVDSTTVLRERGQQFVADGIDLVPAVPGERGAEELADPPDDHLVVDLGVLLEGRRALDVREEERDRAGGRAAHRRESTDAIRALGEQGAAGSAP